MAEQIADRPLTNEELYRLRKEIQTVQEPYIQLLVDLYAVSLPTITIADGIAETNYSPEVEVQAEKIRQEMKKAVEMAVRYRGRSGQ